MKASLLSSSINFPLIHKRLSSSNITKVFKHIKCFSSDPEMADMIKNDEEQGFKTEEEIMEYYTKIIR